MQYEIIQKFKFTLEMSPNEVQTARIGVKKFAV